MLYETSLRALNGKPQSKTQELSDGKGLGVRVSRQGKIRFQFRYKIEGQNKRMDFGDYPDLSLKQARCALEECRSWLAQGFDPKLKRDMTRQESLAPVTVKQALEYWFTEYAEEHRVNAGKTRAQFEKHIYRYIGHYSLVETETRHWLECFNRITKGVPSQKQKPAPVASGYVLQSAKQALKYCRVHHYATSHALDDLNSTDVGKRQQQGDRILTDPELAELLILLEGRKVSFYMRYLCKLLIIFGARTQEVRLSKFSEWDLGRGLWTVPKAHSKISKIIIRPIPESVKPMIEFLFKRHGKTGFLLGEIKSSETVSGSGSKLCGILKHQEPWTLHDLRRTFDTRLNDLGVEPYVVEKLLGHTLGGTMAIYNKSQYVPQKKAALEIWIDRLELLTSAPDNVLLLKRTG
jgi:integrase